MPEKTPHYRWWEDPTVTDKLPLRDDHSWIFTRTGRQFWPWNPRPEDVRIEDIASGVAQENRFSGQLPKPYSVAQHSVLASMLVAPTLALRALLHDAAEGMGFRDLPPPVKRPRVPGAPEVDPMGEYRAAEKRCQSVIYAAFKLGPTDPPEIKTADLAMLAKERGCLFAVNHPPRPYRDGLVEPAWVNILPCWSAEEAEIKFLERFQVITNAWSIHE